MVTLLSHSELTWTDLSSLNMSPIPVWHMQVHTTRQHENAIPYTYWEVNARPLTRHTLMGLFVRSHEKLGTKKGDVFLEFSMMNRWITPPYSVSSYTHEVLRNSLVLCSPFRYLTTQVFIYILKPIGIIRQNAQQKVDFFFSTFIIHFDLVARKGYRTKMNSKLTKTNN